MAGKWGSVNCAQGKVVYELKKEKFSIYYLD